MPEGTDPTRLREVLEDALQSVRAPQDPHLWSPPSPHSDICTASFPGKYRPCPAHVAPLVQDHERERAAAVQREEEGQHWAWKAGEARLAALAREPLLQAGVHKMSIVELKAELRRWDNHGGAACLGFIAVPMWPTSFNVCSTFPIPGWGSRSLDSLRSKPCNNWCSRYFAPHATHFMSALVLGSVPSLFATLACLPEQGRKNEGQQAVHGVETCAPVTQPTQPQTQPQRSNPKPATRHTSPTTSPAATTAPVPQPVSSFPGPSAVSNKLFFTPEEVRKLPVRALKEQLTRLVVSAWAPLASSWLSCIHHHHFGTFPSSLMCAWACSTLPLKQGTGWLQESRQ
jgi:hypothetical protein